MSHEQKARFIAQNVVDTVVKLYQDKIYEIVLYGSYARNEFDSESDIDIMIIFDCPREEVKLYRNQINKIASRVGLTYDVEVSLLIRDKQSFEKGLPVLLFYQNIRREGIILYRK